MDVPFAIHFHLHPDVACTEAPKGGRTEVVLPNNERWAFSAKGAHVSIEDSFYCADLSGPRRSLQIVLRGGCYGENEVTWELERRT